MCTPFTCDYKCGLQWNISSVCFPQLTRPHPSLLPLVLCISYGTLHRSTQYIIAHRLNLKFWRFFWHLQISKHFPIMTLSHSEVFQFWHYLKESDVFEYLYLRVLFFIRTSTVREAEGNDYCYKRSNDNAIRVFFHIREGTHKVKMRSSRNYHQTYLRDSGRTRIEGVNATHSEPWKKKHAAEIGSYVRKSVASNLLLSP